MELKHLRFPFYERNVGFHRPVQGHHPRTLVSFTQLLDRWLRSSPRIKQTSAARNTRSRSGDGEPPVSECPLDDFFCIRVPLEEPIRVALVPKQFGNEPLEMIQLSTVLTNLHVPACDLRFHEPSRRRDHLAVLHPHRLLGLLVNQRGNVRTVPLAVAFTDQLIRRLRWFGRRGFGGGGAHPFNSFNLFRCSILRMW